MAAAIERRRRCAGVRLLRGMGEPLACVAGLLSTLSHRMAMVVAEKCHGRDSPWPVDGKCPCSRRSDWTTSTRRSTACCSPRRRPTSARSPARRRCRCRACRRIVDELERLGLLARQAAAPDRVVASPPSLALRPMLLERERRLTEAHEALVQLSELYRRGAVQREVPDVVDVVLGPDAVRQRLGQLQAAAERRVDAFVLREVALLDGSENTEEDRALARGVQYRVVVEASGARAPGLPRPGAVGDAARRGDPRAPRVCRRGCSSPTARWPCCRCTRTASRRSRARCSCIRAACSTW